MQGAILILCLALTSVFLNTDLFIFFLTTDAPARRGARTSDQQPDQESLILSSLCILMGSSGADTGSPEASLRVRNNSDEPGQPQPLVSKRWRWSRFQVRSAHVLLCSTGTPRGGPAGDVSDLRRLPDAWHKDISWNWRGTRSPQPRPSQTSMAHGSTARLGDSPAGEVKRGINWERMGTRRGARTEEGLEALGWGFK